MDEVTNTERTQDYPIRQVRGFKFSGNRNPELYHFVHKVELVSPTALSALFLGYFIVLQVIDLVVSDLSTRRFLSLLAQPAIIMAVFAALTIYHSRRIIAEGPRLDPKALISPPPDSGLIAPFYVSIEIARNRITPGFKDYGYLWREGGVIHFCGVFSQFAISAKEISKAAKKEYSFEVALRRIEGLGVGRVSITTMEHTDTVYYLMAEEFAAVRSHVPNQEPILPALLEESPCLAAPSPMKLLQYGAAFILLLFFGVSKWVRLRHEGPNDAPWLIGLFGVSCLVLLGGLAVFTALQARSIRRLKEFVKSEVTAPFQSA